MQSHGPASVIVLNGASSSGKTSIALQLQRILPDVWCHFGVDELIAALPPRPSGRAAISFGERGEVSVGAEFRALEAAWLTGLAAMVRAGLRLIIDDVFLSGAASQARLAERLVGLQVCWIGVRCDPTVAAARERARPDRVAGMAVSQSPLVHAGVHYDLEVDTTATTVVECAERIAAILRG